LFLREDLEERKAIQEELTKKYRPYDEKDGGSNLSFKSFLYTVLKISNYVNAINKGPKATSKRIGGGI
jgi:hypothetical protein